MRDFNYSEIREQKWDSDILGLIAAIYKEAGKQELYLRQCPDELEKLVEIAKVQSTEASNAIEGIVTTNTRIRQIVEEKTTPKNRDEQEIAGYRDVLNIIHGNFDAIPITKNYILQLHKILYSHMNNPAAGRTKTVQNYISVTYPDGHVETLFTPLTAYKAFEDCAALVETKLPALGMVRRASMNKVGRFNKQDMRELCPTLSDSSIEGALRKLVAAGELKKEGNGKNTRYFRLN